MSIEPTCIYCKAVDKFRCRSQEEADECPTYQRRMEVMQRIKRDRASPKPEVKPVTVEEIDRAIETLTRLKRQIGANNV